MLAQAHTMLVKSQPRFFVLQMGIRTLYLDYTDIYRVADAGWDYPDLTPNSFIIEKIKYYSYY